MMSVVAAGILTACGGPKVQDFADLKEPRILVKAPQKMLVMELTGDPNTQMKDVGQIFQAWYKIPGVDKSAMPALRARWPKDVTAPREEWVGIWAMPVPDSVTAIPDDPKRTVTLKLETWDYGDTAEILHLGPYSTETATIEKLYAFISNSGYSLAGPHEEEYIKGPSMWGPGDTSKYITIIRYAVRNNP